MWVGPNSDTGTGPRTVIAQGWQAAFPATVSRFVVTDSAQALTFSTDPFDSSTPIEAAVEAQDPGDPNSTHYAHMQPALSRRSGGLRRSSGGASRFDVAEYLLYVARRKAMCHCIG